MDKKVIANSDKAFVMCNYIFLSIVLMVVLYPLIYIVSSSFSSTSAVVSGKVWFLPVEPSLMGYNAIFKHPHIWIGYKNSLIYMVLGTSINIIMTILAAYPLSRKEFVGKNAIMALFVFTMLFNGGLIPTYLLVNNLGLTNTIWAMVIPNAMAVWYVIIARTYFQTTIPDELYEAAVIDGCRDIKFIVSIVVPLSAPIIAVLSLFYAVGHWNSYFAALIYIKSEKLYPLQIILRNILIQNEIDPNMLVDVRTLLRQQGMKDLLKYSLIVVASLPVLIIYPFVQKYFVKGIMVGALKG